MRPKIDPDVVAQLRESDTKEKIAARVRRYRARRSAESKDPVTHPVTGNRASNDAVPPATKSVTGQVLCGHCLRLFPNALKGAAHAAECPVRTQQTATIKRTGECCMDMGTEWSKTPCGCSCHFPGAPSWTMTQGGYGLQPHKHTDESGRCVACGAERG